jgi:hypothetical protein
MNGIIPIIVSVAVAIVLIIATFTGLVWFGFRMGRTVAGFTPEPIIKPKEENLVDDDPYFEAMHGYPQGSTPTVEDRT